ncbi:MAG: 30S ribosomal protein S20 [Patescibacteria group bacterium]
MPITKSAIKALRVAKRRRVFNLHRKEAMRVAARAAKQTPSVATLSQAYQAIDKAVKRGVLKAGTAARRKSQLARLVVKTK